MSQAEPEHFMSSAEVASMPWAFTQHQPADTAHLIGEAKRRGLTLTCRRSANCTDTGCSYRSCTLTTAEWGQYLVL
jgi:hypothetical protein